MPISEAQKRASDKYRRSSCRDVGVRFYPPDMDVFEWLDAKPNKAGYIKELLRREMEREARQQ